MVLVAVDLKLWQESVAILCVLVGNLAFYFFPQCGQLVAGSPILYNLLSQWQGTSTLTIKQKMEESTFLIKFFWRIYAKKSRKKCKLVLFYQFFVDVRVEDVIVPNWLISSYFLLDPSKFCLDKSDGDYGDPTNSHRFISCTGGKLLFRTCQNGLVYNFSTKQCDW